MTKHRPFKFRKVTSPETAFSAVEATATRALYTGPNTMPKVEFTFILEGGEKLIFTLPHQQAKLFIEQGINAYSAIAEPIRIPRNVPWG